MRLFVDYATQWGYLPSSDTVNSNPRFYYIKDNKGNYYSYKRIVDYSSNTDPQYQWGISDDNKNEIVLSNKLIDLSNFTGFKEGTIKQYSATVASYKGCPYGIIGIGGTFNIGESIVVYHPLGSSIKDGKKCDIIVASDMSTVIEDWGPGSFYNLGDAIYFHPFGTKLQIANAIYGALNSIKYKNRYNN